MIGSVKLWTVFGDVVVVIVLHAGLRERVLPLLDY